MKSVSIKMNSPFETELWKVCRRFKGQVYTDVIHGGDTMLSFRLQSSDPLFTESGRYGFPKDGVAADLRIPESYICSRGCGIGSMCIVQLRSADSSRPIPVGFETTMKSRFGEMIEDKSDFPIFRCLKSLEFELAPVWKSCIMALRPDLGSYDGDKDIGRILCDASYAIRVIEIRCEIACLQCKRMTGPRRLLASKGSEDRLFEECSTCRTELSYWLGGLSIKGVDCTEAVISSLTAWIYCDCGEDVFYIHDLGPSKELKVDFTCGCNPLNFSYTDKQRSTPAQRYRGGGSLPSNGACKHFKKSFRWIKYPCCGEWFACMQCHDGRVSSHKCAGEGAELMLCGFCSMEQKIASLCCYCRKETNSSLESIHFNVKAKKNRGRRRSS